MRIPIVSALWARRRERQRTREIREAAIKRDMTYVRVANAMNEAVLPHTVAVVEAERHLTDVAQAQAQAVSGCYQPRNGRHTG